MKYPHIAQRIFNTPLLLSQSKLEVIASVINDKIQGADLSNFTHEERLNAGYEAIKGVGIINVFGSLVHRADLIDAMSGMTSYEFLGDALDMALQDDEVKEIALVISSPGGEVSGAFDLADKIYSSRDIKKITAIVSDAALSAGYLLASAANEVVVTKTGYTGSIGVVMAHVDQSKFDEKVGVKYEFIFAGDHKIDGNSHEPLKDSVKAGFQSEINELYEMFVSTVARNRNISEQQVRDTQAKVYLGKSGLSVGLADRISTEGKELSRLFDLNSGAGSRRLSTTTRGTTMSDKDMQTDSEPNKLDIAAVTDAKSKGIQEGKEEGIKAENERIKSILSLAEAEGREALAKTLAFKKGMTAEDAKDILAASPLASSSFEAVMGSIKNPNVGNDSDSLEVTADSIVKRILNS